MAELIFITGGARSGKSRLAETLAEKRGAPLCYIATGEARDAEMEERVALHRARRGDAWTTVEEPMHLTGALRKADGAFRAVLVDCITLWITNLLLADKDVTQILEDVRLLAGVIGELSTPVFLVSNEVGMGIVPENALARTFRDLSGRANELLAAAADHVYVMFSGIPLKLK